MPELVAPTAARAAGRRGLSHSVPLFGGVVALFVATLATGCAKRLTEVECDALLDHYTARLAREENPDLEEPAITLKQAQARALARAVPAYEFERCDAKVSRAQWECALAAGSVDAIERCLL